jgi:hypothetical protein
MDGKLILINSLRIVRSNPKSRVRQIVAPGGLHLPDNLLPIEYERCAMSNYLELKWEWPANRDIESKVLVKIDSLEETSSGLFSIGKSPSIASNLPDPYTIKGTVLKSTSRFQEKTIQLIIPKL